MTTGSIQFVGEARISSALRHADLAREAVRRFPDTPQSWRSLSRILRRIGRVQEAIACADEALKRFPGNIELRASRVDAAMQLGDMDSALADARSLWRDSPESPIAGRALLDALAASELWDEYASATGARDEVKSDPIHSLRVLARQCLRVEDRPGELLARCSAILAHSPGHTDATYYRAIALARLGRDTEAREAMGLERYLSISEPSVPEGYADGGAFRDALAAEIRANPTLVPDRKNKATRDGLQTLQLRQRGEKAVAALVSELEGAVTGYVAGLAGDTGGFAAAAPEIAVIESWAVVYGRDGRQTPHRHSGGWLSGVYYVAAPKRAGENTYHGMLKVGIVDKEAYPAEPPWGIRDIEPVPGRLVMFPSYMPHATEPTGIAGARISVAFDVVPMPKASAVP